MTENELREKALSLPYSPGVYFYRDAAGTVIYIGKAKILKNRVTQYFHSNRPPKTELMIRRAQSLEYVVTADEFEALVLESTLIKQYKPRYNILLKDDKGYPFIRVDRGAAYPRFEVVNRRADDGAAYYGPYGGRGVAFGVIDAVTAALALPTCSRVFPRDVGRGRPCLHAQTGRCYGPCRADADPAEYRRRFDRALLILDGRYAELLDALKDEMQAASDALAFERAAALRDRWRAVNALSEKQKVFTDLPGDVDAFGWYCGQVRCAFSVISLHGGVICRTRTEALSLSPAEFSAALPQLIRQFYAAAPDRIPDRILVTSPLDEAELTARYFSGLRSKKTVFAAPKRGVARRLLTMAEDNAHREVSRTTEASELRSLSLTELGRLCGLDGPPQVVESFDISHTAGADNVASLVRFRAGRPEKSGYRRFRIRSFSGQDDCRSMAEVVTRRYSEPEAALPDLLLADGGAAQTEAVCAALESLGKSCPVFGMVKDDRHRTRALVDRSGREIALSGSPAAFSLVASIQDEVHRFAVTYHRQRRSARLTTSALESIPGVGPARRAALLKAFGSVKAVGKADVESLSAVVPRSVAEAVYRRFRAQ